MRPPPQPAIDRRTAGDVGAKVQDLLGQYTAGAWKPGATPDPGQALVRIFSHFASIIIDRLNRAPDKAFLAFLNLIGVSQLPPQPARVPLTFHLAQGATGDARVPAGSRVAATAAEGESNPPVFETTSELFLTSASLVAAYVHDPARDAWRDLSALVASATPAPVAQGLLALSGDRPIERRLWISHSMLAGQGPRDVLVVISDRPTDPSFPDMEWGLWDGTAWQPLAPSVRRTNGGVRVTFKGLPPVPIATAVSANGSVSAFRGAWIGARLPHADLANPTFALPPQQISAIKVSIVVPPRDGLLPDAVFSGPTAIDVSKDFLPFGERPKLADVFLLACNEAFAAAGPTDPANPPVITLTLTASDLADGRLPPPDPSAKPESNVTLAWECWNGTRWRVVGQSNQASEVVAGNADGDFKFSDGTHAFMAMTKAGKFTVSFQRPDDWTPSAIGGQSGYWLRVRIAGGGYGHDASYRLKGKDEHGNPVEGYVLDPATWRPPSLRAISCGYSYSSPVATPERVLVEANFVLTDQTATIAAKGPSAFALFPTNGDTAPAVYLGFRRPGAAMAFANQPVTLYVGVDEVAYDRGADSNPSTPAKPPEVAWEYQNTLGWRWLGAQDETEGFVRRGLVTFIGPADIAPTIAFGQEAYWLRARWDSGGYVVPPRINRVVTNTVWAHHATSIANEVVGSGTSEPRQIFHTSMTPVLAGQRVEVGEAEPPTAADRVVLEAEEGPDCVTVVGDDTGKISEAWVRWHEVQDFYGSGPGSRHYTIDRLNGTIAFGSGGRGRTPPRGLNNIRVSYQSGGGSNGNRPAGNITQMKSAVPYVDSATNFEAAGGGADAQNLDEVRRRGPAMLRHQNRAIAIADYEDLAFEASPAVARAKGLATSGAADAGCVELVVVPLSSADQPVPSLELLRQIQDGVAALAPPTVDLVVRGPDWLAVSVSVEVAPVSFERAMELRSAVLDRLSAFLHPLTGGLDGQGWEFGRSPHSSDLYALIEAIPGVDYIRALTVTSTSDAPTISDATLVHAGELNIALVAPSTSNA